MSQLMTLGKSENDMNNTIVVRTARKDYGEKKQDAHQRSPSIHSTSPKPNFQAFFRLEAVLSRPYDSFLSI